MKDMADTSWLVGRSIMASARMQLDAYEALLTKQRNKVTQLETALDSKGKELREFIQALAAQCALPPFHA
jgi:flagellar biosynthesis chaperone FliJ